MSGKRLVSDETVVKLRQADVLIGQGQSIAEAIRAIGVSEVTYYRWRKEFGGLKTVETEQRSLNPHRPAAPLSPFTTTARLPECQSDHAKAAG